MSMNAVFVQVEEAELLRLEARPSLAEALVQDEPLMPPVFLALGKKMEERMQAAGPKLMADAMSRLDPAIRKQLEERLGRTSGELAGGFGSDVLSKLMRDRASRVEDMATAKNSHPRLSLDKDWHGVHYVLCGS